LLEKASEIFCNRGGTGLTDLIPLENFFSARPESPLGARFLCRDAVDLRVREEKI
jgi:hypothetical protein